MASSIRNCVSSLIGVGAQVAKEAAATVITTGVAALSTLAVRNHSVGKIVGGTFCFLGGSYLFVKSNVMKFTSCSWLKSLQNEPKGKKPSPAVKTATAAVGVSMMALGLTCIALGAKELYEGTSVSDPDDQVAEDRQTLLRVDREVQDPNREVPLSTDPRLMKRHSGDDRAVKELYERLNACPSSRQLVDEVQREGEFTVRLGSQQEIPSFAFWHPDSRHAAVLRDLPRNYQLTHTTFELCNAKHASQQLVQASKECAAGSLDPVQYIRRNFDGEYESARCHHRVAAACVQSNRWLEELDVLKGKFVGKDAPYRNAETAWRDYQQDPHMQTQQQAYLTTWSEGCRSAYCKKKPKSPYC